MHASNVMTAPVEKGWLMGLLACDSNNFPTVHRTHQELAHGWCLKFHILTAPLSDCTLKVQTVDAPTEQVEART